MSTMQTMDEMLGRITQVNRMYNYNRNQWRFLLESYLGGEDYKRGQHLTRYQLETDAEYNARLRSTPLENHSKSVINVYNSFMFREAPERDLGSLADRPEVADFLEDADMEGRSLNAFMKDVSTWASVFGHCWILLCKPNTEANTRADELTTGVRPYVTLLSALSVIDWHWERAPAGHYELQKFKYIEDINGSIQTIKEWTADEIRTWNVNIDTRVVLDERVEPNGIGFIPAVVAYSQRSTVRGLGVSDIQDIADLQKFIYNGLSEVEQTIRLDSHPSLVKTPETQAGNGAGSVIHMPENLDGALKPYLLEYNGASVDSIYKAIEQAVDAIDKMANTGSVRASNSKLMSGIAMQTEFQLLNAKLAEKADNLELAEEQMWEIFAEYQGIEWDGEIAYQDSFSISDEEAEYVKLQTAKSAATGPEALAAIDAALIALLQDDLAPDEAGPSIEVVNPADLPAPATLAPTAEIAPPAGAETGANCPVATQDVAVNLANRKVAIAKANYGPLNPALPNRTFWMAKANIFGGTVAEAKTSRCGNCAAFDQTSATLACIDQGLAAGGGGSTAWDTIAQADLGYCEMWDFNCAATRTCDAWVTGGPVTDASAPAASTPQGYH